MTHTVTFQKNSFYQPIPCEVHNWLYSANVGGLVIKMINPTSFLKKLENLEAIVSSKDINWVNALCNFFLGRNYKQPTLFASKKRTEMPKIQVGVGSNDLFDDNNYDIVIKKMASWKKGNLNRIYVDATVNGKKFHYYIDKNGKQGRYKKGDNEIDIPVQIMIPLEMKYLGLKSEKEILEWNGKKEEEIKVA